MTDEQEIERRVAELDRQLHAVREWVLHIERRLDRWIQQVREQRRGSHQPSAHELFGKSCPCCGPQDRGLE
jgi:DNA repair exonuclease SbcCD ATPase subunit